MEPDPAKTHHLSREFMIGILRAAVRPSRIDPAEVRLVLAAISQQGYDPAELYCEVLSSRPENYESAPPIEEILPNDLPRVVKEETSVAEAPWYVSDGKRRLGPFSAGEITGKIIRRELPDHVRVWRTGMSQWAAVHTVPGIFAALPPGNLNDVGPSGHPGNIDQLRRIEKGLQLWTALWCAGVLGAAGAWLLGGLLLGGTSKVAATMALLGLLVAGVSKFGLLYHAFHAAKASGRSAWLWVVLLLILPMGVVVGAFLGHKWTREHLRSLGETPANAIPIALLAGVVVLAAAVAVVGALAIGAGYWHAMKGNKAKVAAEGPDLAEGPAAAVAEPVPTPAVLAREPVQLNRCWLLFFDDHGRPWRNTAGELLLVPMPQVPDAPPCTADDYSDAVALEAAYEPITGVDLKGQLRKNEATVIGDIRGMSPPPSQRSPGQEPEPSPA